MNTNTLLNTAPALNPIGNGKAITSIGPDQDIVWSLALQADGKIVLAGSSKDAGGTENFALARYNSDGTLDVSFGTNGKMTEDISKIGLTDEAYAVALQTDGKILLAGYTYYPYNADNIDSEFVLARYNSDGSLDNGFDVIDDDNVLIWNFGGEEQAWDMVVQPDGKILVVGGTYSWQEYSHGDNFALIRYNSNGTLDTSFGNNGTLETEFGNNEDGQSVTLQTDGKIVVAGIVQTGTGYDFAVTRYNSDGSLDSSFNNGTMVSTDIKPWDNATSVVMQSDGKILVAGSSGDDGYNDDFSVVRYNSDGSLDTSFSGDGKTKIDIRGLSADDKCYQMVVQPDGKILLAGTSGFFDNNTTSNIYDFALARLNPDGYLDSSFGNAGKVITDINGGWDEAHSIALQADGKIVVAGAAGNGTDYDFAVARYNSDGSLDASFNGSGIFEHPPTGTVTISNTTPKQGQTLTANNTLADEDGLGTISYQWQVDGLAIAGATANIYTLTVNEVGKTITVKASYTDSLGNLESVISAATNAVVPIIITSAGVIITGDDVITNEQGDTAVFKVSLKTQPAHNVTITFNSSDPTEGSLPKSKLIFTTSNWATPQTLTVVGVDDSIVDSNVPYNINAAITTLDPNYSSPSTSIPPLNLTNLNDDDIIYGDVGGSKIDDLKGNSGEDVLYGLNMNDDLSGGTGNDTLSGGEDNDVLSGDSGNDFLYGEGGNDTLFGGNGNDTLKGGEGADSLMGNAGDDILEGGINDLLSDTLIGGAGNDTYYVYGTEDIITDNGLANDKDTVVTFQTTSYTLPAGIENGTIKAGTQASNLTGNASNNTLTGNAGKNILIGGAGSDTLNGGAGDDKLYADTSNTAKSALLIKSITCPSKDKLNGGDGNDIAIGGSCQDTLRGDSGNDVLDGRSGKDTLTGGTGKDVFKFTTTPKASNVDTVTDFSPLSDTIKLENGVFKSLVTTGKLAAGLFKSGAEVVAATDADDYLIYNTTSGKLYYDADANGVDAAAVQIALIGHHAALTAADFVVI